MNKRLNTKAIFFDTLTIGYLLIVAWIYILNPSEESLMNLSSTFMICLLAIGLGAVISLVAHKSGCLTLGLFVFQSAHEKVLREPTSWHKTFWGWELLIAFVVTFAVSLQVTGFSFYELTDKAGFEGAKRIFKALLDPDWSILPRGLLAIVETIYIAFLSTVIAVPTAFFLAFFCAKNIMRKTKLTMAIYVLLRTLLNVTRSIEPLIWAIVFSVWVGIGPFAGMLALMLHAVASLAKQYSEIIEGVDEGPIEGISATGANAIQVVWFAIVPQIILPYISFTIYRWDINVRMATVIGLVGGGGIGTLLIQYQGQALWREVGTLAFLIVVVVWSLDTASAYIREALK